MTLDLSPHEASYLLAQLPGSAPTAGTAELLRALRYKLIRVTEPELPAGAGAAGRG